MQCATGQFAAVGHFAEPINFDPVGFIEDLNRPIGYGSEASHLAEDGSLEVLNRARRRCLTLMT